MSYSIITPATDDALESFLPLARVRELCFINHTRKDGMLSDYRRAAFDAGQDFARSSFLPQTIRATFATPYATTKNFGLEGKMVDPDGVQGAVRLPRGPLASIGGIQFLDAGGANMGDPLDAESYTLESNRFIRWASGFAWPSYPSFAVQYVAGFPLDHAKIPTLRMAVGELLAVMWDAQGSSYAIPTSARRVFMQMRPSATYVPGPVV